MYCLEAFGVISMEEAVAITRETFLCQPGKIRHLLFTVYQLSAGLFGVQEF
jgi:hypothetical protein